MEQPVMDSTEEYVEGNSESEYLESDTNSEIDDNQESGEVNDDTQEVDDDSQQVDGDDEDNESGEDYSEIEYEGKQYKVPPELKDAFMRQKAFTQKTQEVAEQRRQLESQVQQFQQTAEIQRANMQGHAQLSALQSQLQQYQNVNWNEFSENDPQAAQQAFFQYSQLKDAADNLGQSLQQQEAQALQQQHALRAKQLEQGKAELARDIPGWNDQTAVEIINHGKNYGFTESELKSVLDPRMVKVLNDARMYRQSLKKATTKPTPEAKPAVKVKGKSQVNKNPDKMTTDEWVKWRNKQLASK